jgi:hypothetical protein
MTPATIALVLASLAAQAGEAPPPPPMDDDPPAQTEPAAPAAPPAPPADAPHATPPSAQAPGEAPSGIDPILTAVLQCGAAGGAACLMQFLTGLPVIGYILGTFTWALCPILVGTAVTFTGDMLGQQRAPLVWPILGAFVGEVVWAGLSVLGLVAGLAVGGVGIAALIGEASASADPLILLGTIFGTYALVAAVTAIGVIAGFIAFLAIPVAAYMLTAEDKRPGDTGQGLPGILEPGHADPRTTEVRFRSGMAY